MSEWDDADLKALLGRVGSFEPGEMIGADYEVMGLLGKGGQAEVYKVRNTKDDNIYVAKIFVGEGGDTTFERERAVYSALRASRTNPHIVHSHPSTGTAGQKVLILDYLEGPTLREYLARHGSSPSFATRVAQGMFEALDSVHQRGWVHRDIKPDNIKMVPERGPVLFDFAIAAEIGSSDAPDAGSPGYVPPEDKAAPSRDVFSLGIVLHECATGRRPLWVKGKDRPEGEGDEVVCPPELRGHPLIVSAIRRAVRYSPESRMQSVGEFRQALSYKSALRTGLENLGTGLKRHFLVAALVFGAISLLIYGVHRSYKDLPKRLTAQNRELQKKVDRLAERLRKYQTEITNEAEKKLRQLIETDFPLNIQHAREICDNWEERLRENYPEINGEDKDNLLEIRDQKLEQLQRKEARAGHENGVEVEITEVVLTVPEKREEDTLGLRLRLEGTEVSENWWENEYFWFGLKRDESKPTRYVSEKRVEFEGWQKDAEVEVRILNRGPRLARAPRDSDYLTDEPKGDRLHDLQPPPDGWIEWDGDYRVRIEGQIIISE